MKALWGKCAKCSQEQNERSQQQIKRKAEHEAVKSQAELLLNWSVRCANITVTFSVWLVHGIVGNCEGLCLISLHGCIQNDGHVCRAVDRTPPPAINYSSWFWKSGGFIPQHVEKKLCCVWFTPEWSLQAGPAEKHHWACAAEANWRIETCSGRFPSMAGP